MRKYTKNLILILAATASLNGSATIDVEPKVKQEIVSEIPKLDLTIEQIIELSGGDYEDRMFVAENEDTPLEILEQLLILDEDSFVRSAAFENIREKKGF